MPITRSDCRSERVGGFCLRDLLTTLSAITLLAGLILCRIRQDSKITAESACAYQAALWTGAMLQYCLDHDGYLPCEGFHRDGTEQLNNWYQIAADSPTGHAGSHDPVETWYNALPVDYMPQAKPASSFAHEAPRHRFYDSAQWFQCPASDIPSEVISPQFPFALFSRAMNADLITPTSAPTIRLDTLGHPAETPLFLDHALRGEEAASPAGSDVWLGWPAAPTTLFAERHPNGGVVTFADGHYEIRRKSGFTADPQDKQAWLELPRPLLAQP